jgi:hypothetical protein
MRGVILSNAFKSYLSEQSYNWPVGKKSTDFDDAYVRDIYVTDTKLHNLKLIGKFFKTEDEEDKYAEAHMVNIGNGTIHSNFSNLPFLHVVKKDQAVLGGHKIMDDGILVVGRQYWSRGMPTMIAMEAPFDDYLAFIEDDMGIEPSDKPTPELYKGYDN